MPRIFGARDLFGPAWRRAAGLRQTLQGLMSAYGYAPIETPALERSELYLRKSGGLAAARLYVFDDPTGHRYTLRPEFTASVMRSVIEHAEVLAFPVRWQYCGPVFRTTAGARELTQLGAELIGSPDARADAEVLALAWHGIQTAGLQSAQMHIGHAGLLPELLAEIGVSERARALIVGNMAALREGQSGIPVVRERLTEFGLFGGGEFSGVLAGMDEEDARSLIRGLLTSGGGATPGGREPDEILARFLAKRASTDDAERLEQALALAAELAAVRDDPEEAFAVGEEVIRSFGLDPEPLEALRTVISLLGLYGIDTDRLTVDLGLARGMAYYTGTTFDLVHPDLPGDGLLGGGGRYDGLVRALGGDRDLPAMGFAYFVESLEAALDAEGLDGPPGPEAGPDVLLIPAGGRPAFGAAVRGAQVLRDGGFRVAVETEDRPLMAARRYAEESGIRWVIVLSESGEVAEEYAAGPPDRFASPRTPSSVLRDARY